MNIIKISKTIKKIVTKEPPPKPPLKLKYGDSRRPPLQYIKTETTKPPLVGFSPQFSSKLSLDDYKTLPSLSLSLLVKLFGAVGVRVVPEIVIFSLDNETPTEAFSNFCATFGGSADRVDAHRLNQVISRLEEMDEFRGVYALSTIPIYEALRVDIKKADELIEQMRKVIEFLDKRLDITKAQKDSLMDDWYQEGRFEKFREKYL